MIRRMLLALAMPALLALGGCSVLSPPPNSTTTSVVSDQAMVKATQALIAAENAYTATALSVAAAVRSGVVPASAAPRIRALSAKAIFALDAAGQAHTAVDRMRQVGLLEGLTIALAQFSGGTP